MKHCENCIDVMHLAYHLIELLQPNITNNLKERRSYDRIIKQRMAELEEKIKSISEEELNE